MEDTTIKSYLEKNKWAGFLKKIERANEREVLLTAPASGLYEMVRKGVNFQAKLNMKIKNIIAPYLLTIWSTAVSPLEHRNIKKYNNVSTIDALKAEQRNYEFAVVLASTHPSLYDSLARITKKLDDLAVSVLILTNTKIYSQRYNELKNLKNCKFIFLDYELKSMSWHSYLEAKKKSRQQFEKILMGIDDEVILDMFKLYKDYLELILMLENIFEKNYRDLFTKTKPKAIIANSFAGALLKVAKEMQIKRMMIQHGTQWGDDTPGVTPDVDELIIWGNFWKENFRRKMSPKTKLIPLGCPRFDEILTWKNMPRNNEFFNRFDLDLKKPTIVFLSQSHGFEFPKNFYESIIQSFGYLIKKVGNRTNYIIKLHPYESPALYSKLLEPSVLRNTRIIKDEVHLYEVLKHCDIAISVKSTSLIEAMAFDVAVIQFNFLDDVDWIDFYKYGGGVSVRSKDELADIVEKLITDSKFKEELIKKQNKFLKSCLTNLGFATNKVINYLLSMR